MRVVELDQSGSRASVYIRMLPRVGLLADAGSLSSVGLEKRGSALPPLRIDLRPRWLLLVLLLQLEAQAWRCSISVYHAGRYRLSFYLHAHLFTFESDPYSMVVGCDVGFSLVHIFTMMKSCRFTTISSSCIRFLWLRCVSVSFLYN